MLACPRVGPIAAIKKPSIIFRCVSSFEVPPFRLWSGMANPTFLIPRQLILPQLGSPLISRFGIDWTDFAPYL